MRRHFLTRPNIFLIALAVLVGLLWAGTIDAEMKWTATLFGLALAALVANRRHWRRYF
jgi:hypothetical protein